MSPQKQLSSIEAKRYLPENESVSQNRHLNFFAEHGANPTDYPFVKTFRAPMTAIESSANRRVLFQVSAKTSRRLLVRMRIDLYMPKAGRYAYTAMRRNAVVLSCVDQHQAEAVMVSLIRMAEALNGLELDSRDLVFEAL